MALLTPQEYDASYFDGDLNTCFLMDGEETPCPENFTKPKNQATITSKQTFYWVILVGFILLVILAGYLINRNK